MKKVYRKGIILIMALMAIMMSTQIISGQDAKAKASPIPDNVNKIFQTSCTPCHWKGGKWMAMNFINFSKWTEYDAAKESKKAGMIKYVLEKGKMPPKKVRKNTPDIVPTKEQIDLINKWADSLKK